MCASGTALPADPGRSLPSGWPPTPPCRYERCGRAHLAARYRRHQPSAAYLHGVTQRSGLPSGTLLRDALWAGRPRGIAAPLATGALVSLTPSVQDVTDFIPGRAVSGNGLALGGFDTTTGPCCVSNYVLTFSSPRKNGNPPGRLDVVSQRRALQLAFVSPWLKG